VPTHGGRRGNPVLWSRSHFTEMRERLHGDAGARHLLADHAPSTVEVELGDDAALLDVDTPEALASLDAAAAA
jgi:molybdenum cofactor cytidylyltransferase